MRTSKKMRISLSPRTLNPRLENHLNTIKVIMSNMKLKCAYININE